MPQPITTTTGSATICTLDVYLGRRLRKWKVGRPKAHWQVCLKKSLEKLVDGPLEIGHADIAVHYQPLYLMEHRRVGQI